MSVSKMTIVAMMLAVSSAQAQPISNEAFERLQLEAQHCHPGKPQPHGDVPVREWRREVRLCDEYLVKANKIIRRCKSGVGENSEACAQLMQLHIVRRYPPPDPRHSMR